MEIRDAKGNILIEAVITQNAEHVEELMQSDYVGLQWVSDVKTELPAGSYIVPFSDGVKYTLYDPYTPDQNNTDEYVYSPKFQHPKMYLGRVPYTRKTVDDNDNPVFLLEWEYKGHLNNLLKDMCDFMTETLQKEGMTNDSFTYSVHGNVSGNVSISVSDNDVLSVLNNLASKLNCEWYIDWDGLLLSFGQFNNVSRAELTLTSGKNVGMATVSSQKDTFFNVYRPQGSSRNMVAASDNGGYYATGRRLELGTVDGLIYTDGCGKYFKDEASFRASGLPMLVKTLIFDEIYPRLDLYAYDIRYRERYLLDNNNEKIFDHKEGDKVFYKRYAVWYMRLAFPIYDAGGGIKGWDDAVLGETFKLIDGYTLMCSFDANTNKGALTSPLAGREFELRYVETEDDAKSLSAEADEEKGDTGVEVKVGDFEIIYTTEGNLIIPTTKEQGLIPKGDTSPSTNGNIIKLFNIVLGEDFIKSAQKELYNAAIREIDNDAADHNQYTFNSDPVAFSKDMPFLALGLPVNYEDGLGHRLVTRIMKLTTKLDFPFMVEITVGNRVLKGTTSQLRENVELILSGNRQASYGEMTESVVRSLIRGFCNGAYLSKRSDDIARGVITLLKGSYWGSFSAESGAAMTIDPNNGQSYLEVDRLKVRLKAFFEQLEIQKVSYVGGKLILTKGQGVDIIDVEEVYGAEGNLTAYRCYFLGEQEGVKIDNTLAVNDQMICKDFNISAGTTNGATNKYYWRLVTAVSTETVERGTKICHWVDLSVTDCDTGSDAPSAGDTICHLGNREDTDRQGAEILSVVDVNSPSFTIYAGIDGYSLTDKDYISMGVAGGKAYFNVYGDMYIGDRTTGEEEPGSYLRWKTGENGKGGKLSIKGEISIKSTLSGLEDEGEVTLEDKLKESHDSVMKLVEGFQNQLDGAIETWFFDKDNPGLTDEPAVNWKPDNDKSEENKDKDTYAMHVGDLYYSKNGKAYRFQKDGDNYVWTVITDNDIIRAIEDAKKANDAAKNAQLTADSKMKVFVSQPTDKDEYDIGDIWVNATYPEDGSTYNNEILHCVTAKKAGASFSIDHWTPSSDIKRKFDTFVNNTYADDKADFYQQLDGKIETWYQSFTPVWLKEHNPRHVGDLWYNTAEKKSYRYVYDEASKTYSWVELQDQAAIDARALAETKKRIFTSTELPTVPYDLGDLWIKGERGNVFYCATAKPIGHVASESDWKPANKEYVEKSVYDSFVSKYNERINGFEEQLDGKIDTWYYNYVPTLRNKPASEWTTDELKASHSGDLFYDTSMGVAYRWTGTEWEILKDKDIQTALDNAKTAQDTADRKRRVFLIQPVPPYDEGDLWVTSTSDGRKTMVCVTARTAGNFTASDWVESNDASLNKFSKSVLESIEGIKSQIDKKAETWYQADDPSHAEGWVADEHVGDLWYDTKNGTTWYYDGSEWQQQNVPDDVFDRIDGKASIYVSKPVNGYEAHDLWVLEATYRLGGIMYKEGTIVIATTSRDKWDETLSPGDWRKYDRYTDDSSLNEFINGTFSNFKNDIKGQIDKKAETWYQTDDPSKAEGWDNEEHVGDLWYKTDTGETKCFVRNDDGTYGWMLQDIPKEVFDIIDGKAVVFVSKPSNYHVRDLWITGSDYKHPKYEEGTLLVANTTSEIYSDSHWVKRDRYTDDSSLDNFITEEYLQFVEDIRGQVDKKAETWYQDEDPGKGWTDDEKRQHVGDLWYDTANQVTYCYRYDSSKKEYTWGRQDIPLEVFDKIDGKAEIFVAKPVNGYNKKDMWILESDYTFNGTDSYDAGTIVISDTTWQHEWNDSPCLTHWKKLDCYSDAKTVAALQSRLENVAKEVVEFNNSISDLESKTLDAIRDGIIDGTERKSIEDALLTAERECMDVIETYDKITVNTAYKLYVAESFKNTLSAAYTEFVGDSKIVSGENGDSVQFTEGGAYGELVTKIKELLSKDAIVADDFAVINNCIRNFNTKYKDFISALNTVRNMIDQGVTDKFTQLTEELGGYSYLKEALRGFTEINGGLILSSVIALGEKTVDSVESGSDNFTVHSGVSGIVENDLGGGIAFWAGGSRIDISNCTKENGKYLLNGKVVDPADFIIRHDGTGYAAGGAIKFNADGTIEADPLSFFVGESTVGNILALFQFVDSDNNGIQFNDDTSKDYVIPKLMFDHLNVGSKGVKIGSRRIYIKDGVMFLEGDLAVTGGITMYASNGIVSGLKDQLLGVLDPSQFGISGDYISITGKVGGSVDGILVNGSLFKADTDGVIKLPNYPTELAWEKITGKPALSISNGVITIGTDSITPLTAHQTIYDLTFAAGKFTAGTFDPNGSAKTINVPTKMTHLANDLFVKGTQTAATNAWTGNVDGLTDYYDGLTIDYYLPFAGTSTAATLKLNSLGAKPVYNGRGKGNTTTHFPQYSIIRMTYYGGAFYASAYYDSTYAGFVSGYCSTAAATAAKYVSATNFALTSGVNILVRFTQSNTAASALTLNVQNTGAKTIYINGTASGSSNYTLPAGTYPCYYDGTYWHIYTNGMYRFTNVKAGTFYGALSGNASTATKLKTAVKLWGQSFDGSANVTGDMTSVGSITPTGETLKIVGNLVVTGGITMYSGDGTFDSAFGQQLADYVDNVTIKFVNNKLVAVNNGNVTSIIISGTEYKPTDGAVTLPDLFAPSAHKHAIADVNGLQGALDAKLNTSLKGVANGLATLDASGKVPSSQLPSYVDDVLEYANKASFPTTGEAGKIYIDKATNLTYRWGGTAYVEISQSLALGETSSTAYAGDKGKQNATDIAALKTGKADKATTLAGYGITDAYTKTEVNTKLTDGSVTKIGIADVGSTTKPIYLKAGVPTAVGASLAVDITGNSATTSKLKTAVTIWGQSFDGSKAIKGNLTNVGTITPTGEDLKVVGNLIVTGGIVMYADNGASIESGFAALLAAHIDGVTIKYNSTQQKIYSVMSGIAVNGTTYKPNETTGIITIPDYPTSLDWAKIENKPTTFTPSTHTHTFASLTSKPTTLGGYGITDAKISNGIITLGSATITPLTAHQTVKLESGTDNGTLKLTVGGLTTDNIKVKGLGSMAFTDSSAYSAASHTHTLKINGSTKTIAATGGTAVDLGTYLTAHQTIYGLTIQANGTSLGTYTPNSAAKTFNITYANVGAAAASHTHGYLPLAGGVMSLGEGLKFHSDNNYFGTNSDARIISLLDGNGIVCDGGLIIDERATSNGIEYVTELLRIRHDEFTWKKNPILHAGNYNSYSPTLTGGGASGTWGISISGNAATASKLGTSNVGSGTQHFYLNKGTATASTSSVGGTAKPMYLNSGVMTAISATVGSTSLPVYLNAGTITACSTTLGVSVTGNAATATTLQTARTLWGQSFNGSANVSGDMSNVGTITPKSGTDLKIVGNLVVTGGITMYATEGIVSNIMEQILVDGVTIGKDTDGKLYAINTGNVKGIKVNGSTFNPDSSGVITLDDYPTSLDWSKIENKPSTFTPSAHTHTFASLTSKPTTIAGYGITDAKISNGVITIGTVTITPVTSVSLASGTNNGTVKLTVNGTTTDIAVKGLGSAAYTASSAYAAASHTHSQYLVSSSLDGYVNALTDNTSANVFVTAISKSGKTLSYTKSFTKKSLSAAGHSGWTSAAADALIIPDMSFIAYWNGAYNSSGNSNLAYCAKGAFGDMATASKSSYYVKTDIDTKLSGKSDTSHTHTLKINGSTKTIAATGGTAVDLGSYLPLAGGTMTGTISSSKTTSTYLAGNQGAAIINSTAGAGWYTMLVKMNSSNGYFTHGTYQTKYLLQYTASTTVSAGTNSVTKSVTLLDEDGNASFPGTVTATTFSGSLSGNASSATKLQTARTIWGQSFNGTANVSGALSNATDITMSGALKLNGITISKTSDGFLKIDGDLIVTGGITMYATDGVASGLMEQILVDGTTIAKKADGTLYALNTGNVRSIIMGSTAYTPNSSGAITLPSSFAPLSHTHTISDITNISSASVNYATSAGNADTVDGIHATKFPYINNSGKWRVYGNANVAALADNTAGLSDWAFGETRSAVISYLGILKPSEDTCGINAHGTIAVFGQGDTHMGIAVDYRVANFQVFGGNADKIVWRKKVAFTDSNVASANKWATARTITLSGSVTGSVSLDGSGNVILNTATNHTHSYLPLSGGTMTGAITRYYSAASSNPMIALTSNNFDVWLWRINSDSAISTSTSAKYGFGLKYIGTGSGDTNNLILYADNQNGTQVAAMIVSQSGAFTFANTVTATTFSGALSGNAATSTKSSYTRGILGRNTSGGDYGATDDNIVISEWNTNSDNRWYLKAKGYECGVGYAKTATKLTSSAGSATLPIYFSDGKPVACTAASVFSNLSNSGNNISVTVAGQNRTLTVGYATNCDTVDGWHASSFSIRRTGVYSQYARILQFRRSGEKGWLRISIYDSHNGGNGIGGCYIIYWGWTNATTKTLALNCLYARGDVGRNLIAVHDSDDSSYSYYSLYWLGTSEARYSSLTVEDYTSSCEITSYTEIGVDSVPTATYTSDYSTLYGCISTATTASNSDTCDGLHVHGGRNNEANKIVRTDGSGHIQCGYINSSSGNEGNNSSPARVWGTNGTDNFMRTYLTSALSVGHAVTSDNAVTSSFLDSVSRMEYGWNGLNYFNANLTAGCTAKTNDSPTSNWWHIMRFNHSDSNGYYTDLAIPFEKNSLYWKRVSNGKLAVTSWVKVLDSLNYNEYAPTKTGTGASGTWGISISGNAATASKWATARTLTLNGSVTGSVSIDGSGNVTLNTTTNHTHSYLPLAGGTMAANARIAYNADGNLYIGRENNEGYVYFQDIASQEGTDYWYITQSGVALFNMSVTSETFYGELDGNASSATRLAVACSINGTPFDGSNDVTTTKWGATRGITLADKDGSNTGTTTHVDGSADFTLNLPSTIKATLDGNASTATALTTSAGSSSTPVYFSGGQPVACGYAFTSYLPLSGGTVTGTINTSNLCPRSKATYNLGSDDYRYKYAFVNNYIYIGGANSVNSTTLNHTQLAAGGIELYHSTPYIDFHYAQSAADYTSRIIATAADCLAISSHLYVGGAGATSYTLRVDGSAYTQGFTSQGQFIVLDGSGNVTAKITQAGDMVVSGGITMYSDVRKKDIISDKLLSVKSIADAPLFAFNYKSDEAKRMHTGTSAQYWHGAYGDMFGYKDDEGYYTLEYQNLGVAMGISLAREIVTFEGAFKKYESKTDKKIRIMKKKINDLEARIKELEGSREERRTA